MNVEVSRYHFFHTGAGTLRWAEFCPPRTECQDHQVCGCTMSVSMRPEGKPAQTTMLVDVTDKIGNRDVTLTLNDDGRSHYTFRWTNDDGERQHAYFWYNDSGRLQIEISKSGYGYVDCFFGHMFYGNRVDIGRLYNGHSPSQIVDLASIGDNDVWAHACSWGNEAMETLPVCDEVLKWRQLFTHCKRLNELYNGLTGIQSVDDIRAEVVSSPLLIDVVTAFRFLSSILDNLDHSTMFKVCDRIETDVHDKSTPGK